MNENVKKTSRNYENQFCQESKKLSKVDDKQANDEFRKRQHKMVGKLCGIFHVGHDQTSLAWQHA